MKKGWLRPASLAASLLALCCIVLLLCCSHYRIWSLEDLRVYIGMSEECHPVWRELYFGRISARDSLDKVIAETRPIRVYRRGEWWELQYEPDVGLPFTGVAIAARQRRLVGAWAWSCTWHRIFFDEMSQEDHANYLDAKRIPANTASGQERNPQ
jgi:hypothetical protein